MKRFLSLILTVALLLSITPTGLFAITANAQNNSTKTVVSDEFIHLTEVPTGYVGIYTKSDLDAIRNNLSGNYILMNDIEFSNDDFSEAGQFYNNGNGWNPIGGESAFSGIFDGNGHSISNIMLYPWMENQNYIGLFSKISGNVKNLSILGTMDVTQKVSSAHIGALAGYSNGEILNCSSSFDITLSAALIQTNDLIIYVGGIVGYSNGLIENCVNNGKINITERLESFTTAYGYFGGICGYSKSYIANCENKSEITVSCTKDAICDIGGICGYLDGYLSNSTNDATIAATGGLKICAGGIVGNSQSNSKVSASKNSGNISGGAHENSCYVAGVVAYNYGEVSKCSNEGEILSKVADYQYAGGVCAVSKGNVSECYNTGAILWTPSAGWYKYTGGIVAGLSGGTISNCYNAGHVSENMWTGEGEGAGIAGYSFSNSTISNCYNVGASGQCAGIKTGSAQTNNCYYLEYSALGDVSGTLCGTSCTINQMSQKETFVGFDFETIWSIDSNALYKFPTLKNNEHNTKKTDNFEEFAGGDGSFENPYLISNIAHLNNISNYPKAFFKLIADIDMRNQAWTSNDFSGVLNGDGHYIFNLKKSLFNDNEGCIVNLHLRNANINGSGFVGRYCFGKVLNCSFSGNAVYGGIVYEVLGSVANCVNYGTITGSTAGGITRYVDNHSGDAGTWHGFVTNCANYGTVNGTTIAGGIAATDSNDTVNITNCYNAGNVYSGQYAGGIFGKGSVSLVNCYNVGLVQGLADVTGALVGYTSNGYAENCYYLDNTLVACPNESITATVLANAAMMKASSFRRFDFNNVWTMTGDSHYLYPELKSVPIDCSETIEYSHSFTDESTTYLKSEANCTSPAKYYKLCAICGEKGEETFEYGLPKEHSFTREVISDTYKKADATCTEAAIYNYCCATCDAKGTNTYKVGNANGHTNATAVVENKVDANCTVDGSYDSVVYCSVCDAELSREAKTIDKLGHNYETKWTTDLEPTCTTVGSKSHHCTRCGDKVEVTEVAKLVHDYKTVFTWSEDHTSCTVVITCARGCGLYEVVECTVTHSESNQAQTLHTAVAEYDGERFTDILTCGNFLITFKDWDGTQISSTYYHAGDMVIVPADPARAADQTYTYAFAGWDNAVVNCTGDAIYTATYTPTHIDYTVVFKNWDGNILSTKTYHYGDTVAFPTNPTRPYDDDYIYTFASWDKEITVCNGNAVYTATYNKTAIAVTSIAVTTLPLKTTYIESTSLDDNGMILTVYYNNNTSKEVRTGWVSEYDFSNVGTSAVKVTYGGKTCTYDVSVVAKTLTDIVVESEPNKLEYLEGDASLDADGLVVRAYYNNDTSEIISGNYTVTGYTSTPGEKTITVTHQGKNATFTVNVKAKSVTSISVTKKPNKLTYLEGDSFDKTGMVITAYYNNNTSSAVTDYTISGYTSTVGTKTITVSYGGKTATFTITVKSKIPSSVSSSKYTISGNTIRKITAGTTVSSLLSGLNEGSYCKVYKGNTQVSGTTAVGTGMIVKIMDGNTVKASYTIIVTGDTNGDGDISITDMVAIKSHVLGKTSLIGVYATAADTSGEGDVTITDFIQIKAKILGKGTITAR